MPKLFSAIACFLKLYKSSSLTDVLKLRPPKVRKQDSIRKKTLDVLFFQAVRDLLSTPLAGQELYDLNVEVFKASTNHISPQNPLIICQSRNI